SFRSAAKRPKESRDLSTRPSRTITEKRKGRPPNGCRLRPARGLSLQSTDRRSVRHRCRSGSERVGEVLRPNLNLKIGSQAISENIAAVLHFRHHSHLTRHRLHQRVDVNQRPAEPFLGQSEAFEFR